MDLKDIEPLKVYEVIAGSHSYGLNTPESDVDIRGVFIEPVEYVLGNDVIEQVQDDKQDIVFYALKKFIRLLSICNPNIIELLYTDERNIRFIGDVGRILREKRDMFLTQKAKYTFTGYAYAQLKKIQGHNKWINNPEPQQAPTVEEFVKTQKISDIFANNSEDGDIKILTAKSDREITYFDVDAFRQKFRNWKEYWRWLENRNTTRRKLEEQHLFDVKHASHLIRLLLQGREILKEGTLTVYRSEEDRTLLKDIRAGKYTFEEVEKMSTELFAEVESIDSKLPHHIDPKQINELLISIYKRYL